MFLIIEILMCLSHRLCDYIVTLYDIVVARDRLTRILVSADMLVPLYPRTSQIVKPWTLTNRGH